MPIMGIDIGTTGCKGTVFDDVGKLCSRCYCEYNAVRSSGYHEINADAVWKSVKKVISSVTGEYADAIDAIGISSFGESAVPVDINGNPLANAILYTDSRGKNETKFLSENVGENRIAEITGLSANKMYTLPKIMWQKRNTPDVYKKAYKFLLFEDFIIFKLTGECCIDYSLASRTMCFDISSKDWSAEMMEVAQINPSKFSTPVKSGTVVGTVKPGIAFELGLSTQTKVVTGAHDQVCASLGAGVLSPGLSLDGTGTVECIATAVNRPYIGESLKKCGYACGPHAIANMYLIYALSFTGGALLKWYRDTFTKHEFDMSKLSDGNIYQQLDAEAGTIPSSLLVLPYFAGACTPYMDESAKGAILGLTLETTKIDIYRALMESVVYEMLLNIEILKKFGIAVKELRATGGGASSPFWLQMKADILEIPVMSFYNCEVANIGAVMLAGVATGKYLNLQEASSALVKTGKTYEPNMGNRSRYREKYSCYKRMYDAVKQVYGEDH